MNTVVKMAKYIVILMLISLSYLESFTTSRLKGAYKTTLINIRNCSAKEIIRPHKSFDGFLKYHTAVFNSSGKSYVKGNFTVLKDVESVKARVRSFIWEDNQWRLRLRIPGFGCHRQIFRLFFQLINWKVDLRKCSIAMGTGSFSKVDVDKFQHAWEPETEYGQWLWIYEATSKGKSVGCVVFETVVTPIDTAA